LQAGHERIGNLARATRLEDVLEVGLQEESAAEKSQLVRQLERDLVPLDADGRIGLLLPPLRVLQVAAEPFAMRVP